MVAGTDQQRLRLSALLRSVWNITEDGSRDIEEVCAILQSIKDGKKQTGFSTDVHNQLALWQNFYHDIWGIKKNFSDLRIPDHQTGFNWLIVMLEGMTPEKIVQKMRERMKVWVWDEKWLNKVTSVRQTNQTYAIRVKDRVEADEELKNLSADDLKARHIDCVTLEERPMLEFFYWWKTKQHLDVENITLCGGSRDSGGGVPCVYWYPSYGGVYVCWYHSDDRGGGLRGRLAVS